MTKEEAQKQSRELLCGVLGLDEAQTSEIERLQRLLELTGPVNYPNVTPLQEELLRQIGAIATTKMWPQL